jgi:hypothetical protein
MELKASRLAQLSMTLAYVMRCANVCGKGRAAVEGGSEMDEDVTGQYARLYAEFCEAVLHAGSVLKMHGMESERFRAAEAKSAELFKSLRALQGKAGDD